MATVVTIAQQKGGSGKTSLAAHLAAYWASDISSEESAAAATKGKRSAAERRRLRVALIDLDPQQSLTSWFRLREELHGPDPHLTLRQVDGWRAATELARAQGDADVIIIDSPPHAETATRVGVRSADLVVVPIQLTPMDVWASRATKDIIERERKTALYVFNRVPARARMAETIAEALKREKLPIANATLGNRVAYAAALMQGRGVTEALPHSTAADEIRSLAAELMGQLQ
jgi:chromosome partitioning protein